ncbi:MAG: ribonuclease Z [Deltaproteobacteria bacterium]|nr:ribonuclease Z [Deltaproteobacteria bacterium]
MHIIIIGSGTCVPSLKRCSPCLLIRAAGTTILCDTGPGSLRQLLAAGVEISEVDMIIYSHFHLDHTADFCPFLFAAKYGKELQRRRSLTVMGPKGLQRWYESLVQVHGSWIMPDLFAVRFVETSAETHRFDGFTIQSAEVRHSDASIAIRIQENTGASVVYSGDTDYCKGIIDISKNASKVILECSCPEGFKEKGHLTPSLAGRIARKAGCKSLLLTHIYPEADRHDLLAPLRKEFDGPAELACDLMSFSL